MCVSQFLTATFSCADVSDVPFHPALKKGEDFKVGAHRGSGGFGSVYEASYLSNQWNVAYKKINGGVDAIDEFNHEVDLLRQLQHPNIVRIYGKAVSESVPSDH